MRRNKSRLEILDIFLRGIRVLLGLPSRTTDAEPYAVGQNIVAAVIAVVVLAAVVGAMVWSAFAG